MDPKKVAAAIKKFRTSLARWLGTIKSGDHELDTSLHFIATALKDISPGSIMGGDSWDNMEAGLEEIEYELGTVAMALSHQRNSAKANKAKQFQKAAEALISEIQKLD